MSVVTWVKGMREKQPNPNVQSGYVRRLSDLSQVKDIDAFVQGRENFSSF